MNFIPQITRIGYQKAKEVLKRNSTPQGFVASSSFAHYNSIWPRDACITSWAANVSQSRELLASSQATLETLKKIQSPLGQIPTVYWPRRKYWDWGESGCTDTSAWFVIAVADYFKTTRRLGLLKKFWPAVNRAFTWLRYQDANNFCLLNSPAAGDWWDSTLTRSGKVLYVNCLFYKAALAMNELASALCKPEPAEPLRIKERINLLFWPSKASDYSRLLKHVNYPRGASKKFSHPCSLKAYRAAAEKREYYLSHVEYGTFVDVCDVLANCLAILWDIADSKKTRRILTYFSKKEVASPFPAKILAEPLKKDPWGMLKSRAELYQPQRWRNPPFHFYNAGCWPSVGGFYVLALMKAHREQEAKLQLEKLSQANQQGRKREWEFNEWLHGRTGKPMGALLQSWSAAGYILAYKAVIEGRKPWQ